MKSLFKHISAITLLLCSIATQPISAQFHASESDEGSGSYTKLMIGAGAAVAIGLGLYWWKTSSKPNTGPIKPQPTTNHTKTTTQSSTVQPDIERPIVQAQDPVIAEPNHNVKQNTGQVQDPLLEPVADNNGQSPNPLPELQGLRIEDFIEVQNEQPNQPRFIDLGPNPIINKQKIEQYVQSPLHTYCTVPAQDTFNHIHHGHQVMQNILSGKLIMDNKAFELEATHADRHTHLNNIVDACWYLYAVAASKDQAFDEGSFIVQDNGLLYDYLLQYVKNVNPDWHTSVSQSNNPYGYSRHSTHIKDCQKEGNHHFGIDIRFGDSIGSWEYWVPFEKQQQAKLPAGKRHILFGRVDENRTFIKMENDGLYLYDGWAQHAAGVFGSVARKLGIGSNDMATYRKEHMPSEIQREIKQLIKTHNLAIPTPHRIGDIITASKQHNVLNDFAARLRLEYDHVEGRFGNEVILTSTELAARLPDNFI